MKLAKTFLIGVLLATGCYAGTRGRQFDTSYQVEKDKTTKAEVLSRLGKPFMINKSTDMETWTYYYVKGMNPWNPVNQYGTGWGLIPPSEKRDSLIIFFKGDLVSDYHQSKSE